MCSLDNVFPIKDPTKPENTPTRREFYDNIIKTLQPSIIDITLQGIQLDPKAVKELTSTVDTILAEVEHTIANSPLIIAFQQKQLKLLKRAYIQEKHAGKREYQYYLKDYKNGDMTHRSYLVNTYLEEMEETIQLVLPSSSALLPTGEIKWSVKEVKNLLDANPSLEFLQLIIGKAVGVTHKVAIKAMHKLAVKKASLYNIKYDLDIHNVDTNVVMSPFNLNSPQQKGKFFEFLGIDAEEFSKDTGAASWPRAQIERVLKETGDPEIKKLMNAFIDHSFSAIIKNNFLESFKKFSYKNVLRGNLQLGAGGAKSFRLTSNNPNMLNQPSSGSRFAKPLKKCLTAPKGFVVAAVDYSALEEVVAANIIKDPTKIKILSSGFDSHCYHSAKFNKEEVEELVGEPNDDSLEWNKKYKELTKSVPKLKEIRSQSKPVSFGLALTTRHAA